MSRELPYFKFFTSEWLNGDIVLESYELQGIFINLCAFYWHRECELSLDQAVKKLRIKTESIYELVNSGIIELTDDNQPKIIVKFLDEQNSEFAIRKKKLSDAGKKGAEIKAMQKNITTLEPPLDNPSTIREDKIIEDKEKIRKESTAKADAINFNSMLEYFNKVFDKKSVVIPESARRSFNARIKEGYTKENIRVAIDNVKLDSFHIENDFKYATISYFSRSKTLDTFGHGNSVKPKKYVPR